MGKGKLILQVVAAEGAILIDGANITLTNESGAMLHELVTDITGHAPEVSLEAPDIALTEDPFTTARRYSVYTARVRAVGYRPVVYNGIMVFDQSTSIQVIEMHPALSRSGTLGEEIVDIGGHALDDPIVPEEQRPIPPVRVLDRVVIPNFVTVHLGRWENQAPNVRVPFIDYIKNVASHEIFDTWPEQTIIANVYCIVSLTLNRVFTEFYRKRGQNFDITATTHMDQKYTHHGTIGARISAIVDRIFNNYLAIVGHLEPFLALYNDGVAANFPGRLSQWGSFFDGRDRGMNAWQIIRKYYPQNLELRQCDHFSGPLESWPGAPLSQGSQGEAVRTLQRYLNRVLGRYTNVIINPVDGVFGPSTRSSVIMFQQIYNLPATGVVDRATWYQIGRIYGIEKALWEMNSEGIRIGIGTTPPTVVIREGATGARVTELQFLLDFIGMYYEEIPFVAETSRFDRLTTDGVRAFQRLFGLTVDGVVGPNTWRRLYEVYWGIVDNAPTPPPTPAPPNPPNMPPYPGTVLRIWSSGEDVRTMQQALNRIHEAVPGIPRVPEDGVFGELTREAVLAFQRIFGLSVDGAVGPITWDRIMREFLNLQPGGSTTPPPPPTIPPYPGSVIRQGATGESVRLIQQAINRLVPCFPNRLWRISEDGIFGNGTRDAVMAVQSLFGLSVDGSVGPMTWDRLMREAADCAGGGGTTPPTPPTPPPSIPAYPGSVIRVGATGESVRLIQQAINRLVPLHPGRLWRISEDGIFGNGTRDAVMAVQSLFGLSVDGSVGPMTWDRLMREAAGQGARAAIPAEMEVFSEEVDASSFAQLAPLMGALLSNRMGMWRGW
ncbi:MAG: peptidoglycan-binding protein [Defluviitaleaceae bacterium]|nr:peptidoglycan-binding protein [Defluviitaleaceae bacterium]